MKVTDATGSYAYNYNNANQRIKTTLADGSYWVYLYDGLGQVTSGKRYWADTTPVAGQQFEYGFDEWASQALPSVSQMRTVAIANRSGNRELAKSGGNSSGTGLRTETYTPTLLNQYSQRTEANTFDVMGLANASATVTVNSQSTYRKNEYFQKELSVSNGSNPVWQEVDIVATLGGSSTSSTGFVYTAKTPVIYMHDDDGNLLMDGQWMNVWDAENRLVSQQSLFTVPAAAKKKLEYEYDYRGRRIRKKAYDWNGSAWVADEDLRFVYDGWNLIAQINASDVIQQSFMWGLDLSGSLQGAGGVGGLVKMMDHGSGKHYFYGYDGNGNVMSLVDGTAGTYAANYEYGPFGETVRASGTMALANPFRFSTKYQDPESGLLYYGFRYYDPEDGRWLNRDPIGERGGKNVYGFVLGSAVNNIDPIGLEAVNPFGIPAPPPNSRGYGKVAHGAHKMDLTYTDCCGCENTQKRIYEKLKKFADWGNNSISMLQLDGDYAAFVPANLPDVYANVAAGNTASFMVKLSYDDKNMCVSARTLVGHSLTGMRKWCVSRKPGSGCTISLTTEAYEQFSSWEGALGASLFQSVIDVREKQAQIWREYFQNIEISETAEGNCLMFASDIKETMTHQRGQNPWLSNGAK